MKRLKSYFLVVNGKQLGYRYHTPLQVNRIMLKMIRSGFSPESIKIGVDTLNERRQYV